MSLSADNRADEYVVNGTNENAIIYSRAIFYNIRYVVNVILISVENSQSKKGINNTHSHTDLCPAIYCSYCGHTWSISSVYTFHWSVDSHTSWTIP